MTDTSLYEKIASLVLFHRKKMGLNRIELARLAGVGKTAVFDIEHAKKTIQLETLVKILSVLNIQLAFNSPLMSLYTREEETL